jgi:hypothetical protein
MKSRTKKQNTLLRKAGVRNSISVKHQYSGNASKDFWNIVNSINNEADRQELYSLGVALQNMEEYVLKQLQHLKKSYVRGRKYYL